MKRICLIGVVLLSILQLKSQIHFGDDAKTVEAILKFAHKYPHLSYVNGKIEYISQCEKDRYALDFEKHISYCDYYVMDANEKYVCHLRKFENISIEELKRKFNELYSGHIIDKFYFDDNYEIYYEIYLSDNKYATSRGKRIVLSNFNPKIRSEIEKKLAEINKKKQIQIELEQENKRKQKERVDSIKTAIYDLKTYSNSTYRKFLENLSLRIRNELSEKNMFSYQMISELNPPKRRFTSVYALNYGYLKNQRSEDFDYFENIVLKSGDNDEIQSLKNVNLPLIYINDYKVHTETKFENIKIDYVRGITRVKINNGMVVFQKDIPDEDIQEILSRQLINKQNGLYVVKYEVSDILGEKDVNIIADQIKTTGRKVLIGLGIIGLLLLSAL